MHLLKKRVIFRINLDFHVILLKKPNKIKDLKMSSNFTWFFKTKVWTYQKSYVWKGHEKSRSALQRYLFYCNRYRNHMQSLKFENKLYSMAKEKMEEMQNHNMSWIETQFLKKAVDILCDCRQGLLNCLDLKLLRQLKNY